MPEFAASIAGIMKKEHDIVVSNIIGSNIFNILFILGISSLINPIAISRNFLYNSAPWMLVFTILTYLFMRTKGIVSRKEALVLLLCYGLFITSIIIF